jgi:hypothetical protein
VAQIGIRLDAAGAAGQHQAINHGTRIGARNRI